ncbi:50S ribosomal protein L35ae [Candidatus Woesearchaeota archaeon]|nr:50S ribosomal protein L35ae [Candidatus Woesearchaeota archaeon]MBW3016886.1 50S ribosomal protein L35ae [Candidatus Woesearchaeota archaeon]
MKGVIVNFRGGRHTQYDSHMIVKVDGVADKAKAQALVGKAVTYTTESGKQIKGTVANVHGNSGSLRVVFEKGMPGQSIGRQVEIAA